MMIARLISSSCMLVALAPALAQVPSHGTGSHAHSPSPYAGEQAREIKALSAQEQRAWSDGQGMGLARAAELNGYPGPMHVLEHAEKLRLTPGQAQATRDLMHQHKTEVRRLGAQLVDAERELDQLFRDQRATEADVRSRTTVIAALQAQIRASHLTTHLKQTALLETAQVAHYSVLRGYR